MAFREPASLRAAAVRRRAADVHPGDDSLRGRPAEAARPARPPPGRAAWRACPAEWRHQKKSLCVAAASRATPPGLVVPPRRNDLPWDAILGSETAGDYKPKPRVYLAACEAFSLEPAQCMMAAAHSRDIAAAVNYVLLTAHNPRRAE